MAIAIVALCATWDGCACVLMVGVSPQRSKIGNKLPMVDY